MNLLSYQLNNEPLHVRQLETLSDLKNFLRKATLEVSSSGRFVFQKGTRNSIELDKISCIFFRFVNELLHEEFLPAAEIRSCLSIQKKIKKLYLKSREQIDEAGFPKAHFLRWLYRINDSDALDPTFEPRKLVLEWETSEQKKTLIDHYQLQEASSSGDVKSAVKIKKTISILYFPRSNKFTYGHTKLRVGDEAWGLIDFQKKAEKSLGFAHPDIEVTNRTKDRSMQKALIEKASQGGKPFFEFKIKVEPEVFRSLLERAWRERSFSCSLGALSSLADHGGYSVPYPLRLTPLISAIYLSSAKALKSPSIHKVKFHGSPSSLKNSYHCIRGVVLESLLLMAITYVLYYAVLSFSRIPYSNYR